MNFLNKWERRFGKYAIHGLMKYIIVCYIIGYVLEFAAPNALYYLTLEPYMIFHYGQIWRIVSWILIPPSQNIIFAIIMIIFYYQLGTVLEQTWGAFRFNVYIFGGMIFTVAAAIIMYFVMGQPVALGGYFSTYYINLSIFLAFAVCYPDMKVMLYFIIPVKMKWMAIVYVVLVAYDALTTGWVGRVAIIASLLNFIIFFFSTRNYKSYSPQQNRRRREWKKATSSAYGGSSYGRNSSSRSRTQTAKISRDGKVVRHKCAICGRTELDDPNLEFRYCSKCEGDYEYCQDHLFTHQHVKRS